MASPVQTLLTGLAEVLPAQQISTDTRTLQSNSQDYAWFSNVLEEELGGCCADVVVWPANEGQLADVLAVAHAAKIPITVRGGGTGNTASAFPCRVDW